MKRDEAYAKLKDWVESPSLLRHSLVVENVMRAATQRYGPGSGHADIWGLAGLLHDADYERFPEEHPRRIVAWLRERGEEEIAYAISAHWTGWNVPARSQLDRALLACDELSGFVVACALLRPDGIQSLESSSVVKKLNNPKFAASVERSEIAAGIRMLGVDLAEHIDFILAALRPEAAALGLEGSRAG